MEEAGAVDSTEMTNQIRTTVVDSTPGPSASHSSKRHGTPAAQVLADLEPCLGCRNKAKRGCSFQRCRSCCIKFTAGEEKCPTHLLSTPLLGANHTIGGSRKFEETVHDVLQYCNSVQAQLPSTSSNPHIAICAGLTQLRDVSRSMIEPSQHQMMTSPQLCLSMAAAVGRFCEHFRNSESQDCKRLRDSLGIALVCLVKLADNLDLDLAKVVTERLLKGSLSEGTVKKRKREEPSSTEISRKIPKPSSDSLSAHAPSEVKDTNSNVFVAAGDPNGTETMPSVEEVRDITSSVDLNGCSVSNA
eukprot:GILJ01005478.1.p1 GENE.GILJ01005478.1~~GILJ01005478.1.p1  ORF type:complete len:315 (-),score=23.12 GILJ01005478.1:207-1112(-)